MYQCLFLKGLFNYISDREILENVYKILFLYSVFITCGMDRNNFKSRLHIPCTCTGICVYVTVLRSKQDVYWQLLFLSIFNLPHVNIHSPMTGNRDPQKTGRLSGQCAPLPRQTRCRRVRAQTERQLGRPFV